jgi:hypothetical protein
MANAWTQFVKKWASDNGVSYACALSDPRMKEAYGKTKSEAPKLTVKRIPRPKSKKLESAMAKSKKSNKNDISYIREAAERELMGKEDVYIPKTMYRVNKAPLKVKRIPNPNKKSRAFGEPIPSQEMRLTNFPILKAFADWYSSK